MARERKTNFAKCTVWTETLKADFSGTIAGCCRQLFTGVPTDKQGALLDVLKQDLENRLAKKGGAE